VAAEFPQAPLAELLIALRERWGVLQLQSGWVGDMGRIQAERAVRKLAQYISDNTRELVGTEVDLTALLEFPDGPVRLGGRVDRLERDENGLHIIDFKTGGSAPTKDKIRDHPQLATYQLAVQAGAFSGLAPGLAPAGAALVQLGTKAVNHGVQRQAALAPDGAGARELVERVAKGMAQAHFPATLNELCDRCPVRTSCPAQPEGRSIVE
ncbi:MAG: RecB family exonuclease, partial [Angustibacter sp.]